MFSSGSGGQMGGNGLGGHGDDASNFGGPPPVDSLFENAFEELDDEIMDRLILEATLRENAAYEFLDVGLGFHEKLRDVIR